MDINTLDILYENGIIKNTCDRLSGMFLILNYSKLNKILNLNELTIGALLDIGNAVKPSDIYHIIKKDLNVRFTTREDEVRLYIIWKKKLDNITKQFQSLQKVIIPSTYKNEWSRASNTIPVAAEVSLIDNISQRMHISWKEAEKLKWSEVLLMMRLDKQKEYFDYLVQQKNKSSVNK